MTSMKDNDNVVNMNTRIELLYIESKTFEEESFRLIYQKQNYLMSQLQKKKKNKFYAQEISFEKVSAERPYSDVVPKEKHKPIAENLALLRDIYRQGYSC